MLTTRPSAFQLFILSNTPHKLTIITNTDSHTKVTTINQKKFILLFIMHLPRFLLLPFLLPFTSSTVIAQPQAASSDEFDEVDHTPPQTLTLHRWPISSSDDSQTPIGTIRYSLNSRKGIYNPTNVEQEAQSDEYYRVGMLKGGKWVGGVVRGVSNPTPRGLYKARMVGGGYTKRIYNTVRFTNRFSTRNHTPRG